MAHCLRLRQVLAGLVTITLAGRAWCVKATELSVRQEGEHYAIEILSDGQCLLASPAEGLWSIATGWAEDWPAGWIHAQPTEVERVGGWTILRGQLKTATGTLGAAIQREHTERTLLESERRYRSIFNGVEVSIWEQDYSDVRQSLRTLQTSGVSDLRRKR